MANINPGYTRVDNHLLEQIAKCKLNATQFRILMIVLRYTNGFNREDHEISLTFLKKATGLGKTQLDRAVKQLIDNLVLTVTKESTFTKARKLALNNDYQQWKVARSEQKSGQSAKTLSLSGDEYRASAKELIPTVSKNADQEKHSFKNNSIKNTASSLLQPKYPAKTNGGQTNAKNAAGHDGRSNADLNSLSL
jgi:phage replication O-like protein O